MSDPLTQLRDKIKEREKARDAYRERERRAKIEADKIDVEVAAFKEALALMTGKPVPAEQTSPERMTKSRKKRGIAEDWKRLFRRLNAQGVSNITYSDISSAAMIVGHAVSDGHARTQMMNYRKAGYFESPKPGVFVITPLGRDVMGIRNEEGSAEAEPSEERGGGTVQGDGFPPVHPEGSSPSTSTATPDEESSGSTDQNAWNDMLS